MSEIPRSAVDLRVRVLGAVMEYTGDAMPQDVDALAARVTGALLEAVGAASFDDLSADQLTRLTGALEKLSGDA